MVREKRILSYFIGWLLVGFLICFVGLKNVKAEVITPTTGFRSQIGTLKTNDEMYWAFSEIGNYGQPLYFGTGPQFGSWGVPSYIRLMAITDVSTNYSYKVSYNMTIFTPNSTSNTWDATKIDNNYNLVIADDAGVVKDSKCTVVSSDSFSGNNGTFVNKSISCIATIQKNYSNLYLSTGYYCKNCSLSSLEQLGYVPQDSYVFFTEAVFERFSDNSNIIVDQNQTIIDQNSQIIQGQDNIINNNKENTDSIIDNNNQNTQEIIDSNKETQETIKEQFNNCFTYDIRLTNNDRLQSGYIKEDGTIVNSSDYGISDYVKIYGGYSYSLSKNYYGTAPSIVFYDKDKNYVMGIPFNNLKDFDFTLPKEISYFRITLPSSDDKYSVIISTTEICSNKIDETNDKLDNLQGALTDDSSPDTSGLADSAGWLPPGPLDSVLNLPLSLFNSLTTNLNKSCSPISIPLPYVNKNLTIPCIKTLYDKIGVSTFITWLGVIVSGLMLYTYLLKLYKWIEDRISLNETHSVDNWGGL